MSNEAIARRLEELGALYRLSMSLLGARRIGRIEHRKPSERKRGKRGGAGPASEPD